MSKKKQREPKIQPKSRKSMKRKLRTNLSYLPSNRATPSIHGLAVHVDHYYRSMSRRRRLILELTMSLVMLPVIPLVMPPIMPLVMSRVLRVWQCPWSPEQSGFEFPRLCSSVSWKRARGMSTAGCKQPTLRGSLIFLWGASKKRHKQAVDNLVLVQANMRHSIVIVMTDFEIWPKYLR